MVAEAWKAADPETRRHYVEERRASSLPQHSITSASDARREKKMKWTDSEIGWNTTMTALSRVKEEQRLLKALSDQFVEIAPEEARELRVPDHIVLQVNASIQKRKAAIANLINR